MCIRRSRGHFIKVQSKWYEGFPSPSEAEALGLRDAILWFGNLGLSKVHVELYCKLVVDNIVDNSKNELEFGNIIAICRIMLQQHPNFKINFVMRQANCVTHSLTKASKLYTRHQIFNLIPSYISTIVMNEII